MPNYVFLRSGTYYFRRVVPIDLQPLFGGKKELTYSLRTKDARQAARLGRLEAVKTDELFAAKERELVRDSRRAAVEPRHVRPPCEVGEVAQRAMERLRRLREEYAARGELPAFREYLLEEQAWQQSALDNGPVLWEGQTLEEGLRNAEAGRNAIRALLTGEGAMVSSPHRPITTSIAVDTSPFLSALVDRWAAEKMPTTKSVEMWRRTVALFEHHAGRAPIGSITKRQVISFKDHLISEGKSRATVANRINQLRALFRYAVEIDLIYADPSAGVRVLADKRAKRLVFHSLRHTFKHFARECGFAKAVNDAITGHESGDVGDDYGGLDYPLRPLVESMSLYRVPGFQVPIPPPAFRDRASRTAYQAGE